MLTKTITSFTHKTPHKVREGSLSLSLSNNMTALTAATALACILLKRFSL